MKRIMIVGCPRSGTTFLQQLIGTHSEVYTTKETHYFDNMLLNNTLSFLDFFYIPKSRFFKWKSYVETFKILKSSEMFPMPRDREEAIFYFIRILDYNASFENKKIWLEKTPVHLFAIKHIQKSFSDVKYIHIIREPLDLVASLVDVGKKYPKQWPGFFSIDKSLRVINKYLKESLKYLKNENHYFVDYSSLILNPSEEIEKIFNFLEIEYDRSMLQDIIKKFGDTIVYRNDEGWKKDYGKQIHKNIKNKFNKIFTTSQRRYIRNKVKIKIKPLHTLISERIFHERLNKILNSLKMDLHMIEPKLIGWNTNYYECHKERYKSDVKIVKEVYMGGSILEIGSFPYHLTYCLQKMGYPIMGLDINPSRGKEFIKKNNILINGCDIEKEKIPFRDNTFDLIIFNEIFEHLRINPIFTLMEINRVLREGGIMILTTPNLYSLRRIFHFLNGEGFNNPYEEFFKLQMIGHMGHIREYSTVEIKQFLENTGFRVINVYYKSYSCKSLGLFIFPQVIYKFFPKFKPYQVVICKKQEKKSNNFN